MCIWAGLEAKTKTRPVQFSSEDKTLGQILLYAGGKCYMDRVGPNDLHGLHLKEIGPVVGKSVL